MTKTEKVTKRAHPAIRSHRARVRWLLSHQHRPDVKELLEGHDQEFVALWHKQKSTEIKMWSKTRKDSLPFPLSCLANQQSSGHSWGRLGLCTRLCETVAQCLSALQTPCWPTTAAARRHGTEESCHVTHSGANTEGKQAHSDGGQWNTVPVLYASHSCGGNSGGRSSSSERQFSNTSRKAE